MNGAIAPFNTHVQHENAKYRKAANSVGAWPVRRKVLKWVMAASIQQGLGKQRPSQRGGRVAWTMSGEAVVRHARPGGPGGAS